MSIDLVELGEGGWGLPSSGYGQCWDGDDAGEDL